jgi:hypothetical protein
VVVNNNYLLLANWSYISSFFFFSSFLLFSLLFSHQHNGEKGMWEKWTLFDESLRVPLLIAHPASPFAGRHYTLPVELVDVYPTALDLVRAPFDKAKVYRADARDIMPQGKSLAVVVLGVERYRQGNGGSFGPAEPAFTLSSSSSFSLGQALPRLEHDFAVSQILKCTDRRKLKMNTTSKGSSTSRSIFAEFASFHASLDKSRWVDSAPDWADCDTDSAVLRKTRFLLAPESDRMSVMGYSLRTPAFKYIAFLHYNMTSGRVNAEWPPFWRELYDHRNETLQDFTHLETANVVKKYPQVVLALHRKLVDFVTAIVWRGDSIPRNKKGKKERVRR